MKIMNRSSIFETNLSSCHSIDIKENPFDRITRNAKKEDDGNYFVGNKLILYPIGNTIYQVVFI